MGTILEFSLAQILTDSLFRESERGEEIIMTPRLRTCVKA